MFIYNDKFNISLPIAVFLCHDQYDYKSDPYNISASSLIKPLREIVLGRQNMHLDKVVDISDLIASRMGQSIHDGAEKAWKDPEAIKNALEAKGMGNIADRVKINPDPDTLQPNDIPVYLENRASKVVGPWTVTGRYDIVYSGQLSDYKSTSVWSIIFDSNSADYILQGSIYKWLNPEKITKDTIEIQYIFTDWVKSKAKHDKNYPQAKFLNKHYPLMTIEETEAWVKSRLTQISSFLPMNQLALPECSKEELWQGDTKYKYYKNPASMLRSTKNFDTQIEADTRFMDDGAVGKIVEEVGLVKRCRYCSVIGICDQAAKLKDQNLLSLD